MQNEPFFVDIYISVKEITDKMYEVWDELREEMHGVASLIC